VSRSIVLALFVAGCGAGVDELNLGLKQCPTTTIEGVDVYQGDNPINWNTVQGENRVFAFSKASQGDYNKQSNFATNWTTLKSLGMARGAYHYFDATIDGATQAKWFLDQVAAAGGFQPGDLPPALDLECPVSTTQGSAGNMCLGNGKNGWAPTATIIQGVWAWLDAVESATGMKPIIYSYVSWFATFGFTDPKLANYPLWIASPISATSGNCATVPAPWTQATFWQYQTTMHLNGIGSGTMAADEDRFIGTIGALTGFVAADSLRDGGSDGATDGATSSVLDAAAADLSSARDLTVALDGARSDGAAKGKSSDGCGCQLGGAAPPRAPWLLLFVFLAVALPRSRARR
jgi:GH25 family lysozyme M1 (1,4-beta-N-acetylmuramidase)